MQDGAQLLKISLEAALEYDPVWNVAALSAMKSFEKHEGKVLSKWSWSVIAKLN